MINANPAERRQTLPDTWAKCSTIYYAKILNTINWQKYTHKYIE